MAEPYVVKEEYGNAYTIRKYVTDKPLPAEELVPDEHGIYPVNPLGYPVQSTDVLSAGFAMADPVYAGGVEVDPAVLYDTAYRLSSDAPAGTRLAFPVESVVYDHDNNTYVATVSGDITDHNDGQAHTSPGYMLQDATSDSYRPTGLLGILFQTAVYDEAGGKTTLEVQRNGEAMAGTVGEGKLNLVPVNTQSQYLYREDNKTIYDGTTGARIGVYDPSEDAEPGTDTTACEVLRKGYSDREVMDWVESRVGGIINSGCHPSSIPYDLTAAGGITRWFLGCGMVDISSDMGRNKVMVPGFGLGAGYMGNCPASGSHDTKHDVENDYEHPMLVFGYGTKSNAVEPTTAAPALPMDWPFSTASEYADTSLNNSITLFRKEVELPNGKLVGGLERDEEHEVVCSACEGIGRVIEDGVTRVCTSCGGTGLNPERTRTVHTLRDRIHVCLYNDFTPTETGETVLKKTFINLATPLSTKEGSEFEITVSLPNVGENAFGSADAKKNLSGYYAYISQPRVYVLSGTWKFSPTRVKVVNHTVDSVTFDVPFKDASGEELPEGTAIRFTIKPSAFGVKPVELVGTIESDGSISITSGEMPDAITYRRGNIWSACGAAYVEDNNDTIPSTVEPLGLNDVRSEDASLSDEKGDATCGLDEYNRFFTVKSGEDGRTEVVTKADKRQVVATVYPTVTNTFPWRLTYRRKLGCLDRIMTDEADAGMDSIFGKVSTVNRMLLRDIENKSGHPEWKGFTPEQYPLSLHNAPSDEALDLENGTDIDKQSFIGAMIHLDLPNTLGGTAKSVYGWPVRQALRAVKMLADDFRKLRVTTDQIVPIIEGLKPDTEAGLGTWAQLFDDAVTVPNSPDNDYDQVTWRTRLRNMSPNLSEAQSSLEDEYPSPWFDMHPFLYEGFDLPNYYSNPYGFGEFDSTDSIGDIDCDPVNNEYGFAAGLRSVVKALTEAGIPWVDESSDIYVDLLRRAELDRVKLDESYRNGSGIGIMGNREPYTAFTKLISVDSIPCPSMASYPSLDTDQYPFISGDAYWLYRTQNDTVYSGDTDYFIATTAPVADDLAEFLKEYVPEYGACMPVRHWDSFRVGVPATQDPTVRIHKTRMTWYDDDFGCSEEVRGKYATDTFMKIPGNEYFDNNMNFVEFADEVSSLALGWSEPPYTIDREIYSREPFTNEDSHGAISYIRVFMKFTFSAQAGRWYCTDYRQAPVSYLTPLYGAKALDATIDGKKVWVSGTCDAYTWKNVLSHTYHEYKPLEINPELVTQMYSNLDAETLSELNKPGDPVVEREGEPVMPGRLMHPWWPTELSGLGLSMPCSKTGGFGMLELLESWGKIPHANFWSVREHLRPATGAALVADVPYYMKDENGNRIDRETGGIMSDAVLWGQYEYPAKGEIRYHLPDTEVPGADLSVRYLAYARQGAENRINKGKINIGNTAMVLGVSSNL